MTENIYFALLNLGSAVWIYISIARGLRDKQLKITLISPPITKVEKVVLKGRGLTLVIIGFGISATIFTYSGLNALSPYGDLGTSLLLMLISIPTAVVTMRVASHINPKSED